MDPQLMNSRCLRTISVMAAVAWLLFVNAVFFWQRLAGSAVIKRLLENPGAG